MSDRIVDVHGARQDRPSGQALLFLCLLTALAAALRFYGLGRWAFDSDETFTLRDSLHPYLDNPRPLLYVLNHYAVQPFLPLDEFGLRLLPALFGVLAIPTLYVVARRLVGSRAALFGALLLAVSPLHVYYSQFARYWSLVFLLTSVYPYAIYWGIRGRDRNKLIFGLVTGAIATLAHPASVLLAGGLALWFALTYLWGYNWHQLWRMRVVQWGAALTIAFTIAVAVRFLPMLRGWIDLQDNGKQSEFLLHLPTRPGIKQLAYLLSYAESLTLPLVAISLVGLALLWQNRDRSLARLLSCMLAFPVTFLVLLSFRTPVSTFYLVPPLPIFFIGAGVFLDQVAALALDLRPRWLLAATVAFMAIAAGAPTLVSQYRDGRRYDYRTVARWLDERLAPGDVIFSDQPKVLIHYRPGTDVQYLNGDPALLMRSLQTLRATGRGQALWVISPAPAHAFRTNASLNSLTNWIYNNCQLRNTVGVGRVDFRQYHLQIYRCPAGASVEPAAQASAGAGASSE